jgi:hypothetical protein
LVFCLNPPLANFRYAKGSSRYKENKMAYGDFTEDSLNTAVIDLFGLPLNEFPEKVIFYPFGLEKFLGRDWHILPF